MLGALALLGALGPPAALGVPHLPAPLRTPQKHFWVFEQVLVLAVAVVVEVWLFLLLFERPSSCSPPKQGRTSRCDRASSNIGIQEPKE